MAKVMGTEKQLRSVEKTRMGELKKLKHESEGSLEQHKIKVQSFKGTLLYHFGCFLTHGGKGGRVVVEVGWIFFYIEGLI